MTTTVRAVYENGVLRPDRPLPLAEGTAVEVAVTPAPEEDEIDRRLRSARTFDEWLEATKLLPPDDGGYDILAALNENRLWAGERPFLPTDEKTP